MYILGESHPGLSLLFPIDHSMNIKEKAVYVIIMTAVTAMYFLLTVVVALFLLSTLNILNNNMMHVKRLEYVEATVSAAIFLTAGFIYFRSLKKMSAFIKDTFIKRPGP